MNGPAAPIVVIGVGNALLRDDGVGVRVVESLRRAAGREPDVLPPLTRLVDGGTLGIDLLREMHPARAVLLVDGVDLGLEPGTVEVLRDDALAAAGGRLTGGSSGGIGELLALGRLMDWLPAPVALVGIQVAEVTFDLGLSAPVASALPLATETALRMLRRLDAEAADAGPVPATRTPTGARA